MSEDIISRPIEEVPEGLWEQIRSTRKVRMATARGSHYWFFNLYLGRYVKYPTASFQRALFDITEDPGSSCDVIVAFRGSGKSTIVTVSYPIWAVLGTLQKKFVLILGQTQSQARMHLANIKAEFETNDILRNDFGPLEEQSDEWGSTSLVLKKYGARISCASVEQSIRGIRHGEFRPDLIICDDVEDMMSIKTREGRDKTFNWLTGEVIPAGDQNTKVVLVGNLLHEDSLLMRLKDAFESERLLGRFWAYPLVDYEGRILWPGKFSDEDSIERLHMTVGSEIAWQREYMLRIIPDEDQLVHPDWIQYYDPEELPSKDNTKFKYTGIGIDLAISQRDTADYTAMVMGQVHGYQDDLRIFILPYPVNKRLTHLETLDEIKRQAVSHGDKSDTRFYVEEVGYQGSVIEQLKRQNYNVEGAKVAGQDKRARLTLVTHLIQNGKVKFPRKGAEHLIQQLTGFGVEKHDDLVDAFAILMHKILEHDEGGRFAFYIGNSFWSDEDGEGDLGFKRVTRNMRF